MLQVAFSSLPKNSKILNCYISKMQCYGSLTIYLNTGL